MGDRRFAPSDVGLVAITYERKGIITFFAQISDERVAWQRRNWEKDFDQNWDDPKVIEAINNFLWVAKCENERKILPRN